MEAKYEDQRQKIRGPTKQQRKKKNSCAASMWTYKNPFNMIQSIEYCHLIFEYTQNCVIATWLVLQSLIEIDYFDIQTLENVENGLHVCLM